MSLAKKVIHGMGWVFFFSITTRGTRFLTTLILARLLTPADFGLVAIGLLVINTLSMFRDMGIGAALIYQKEDIEKAANTAFILFPIIGVVLFTLSYALSPLTADFFNSPESGPVIRWLSLTLLFVCFGLAPSALLDKELNFKRQAFPEIGAVMTYAAIAIPLAYSGLGVWSIVYGKIVSEMAWVLIIWSVSPWKPKLEFDWAAAKSVLGYGQHILGAGIIMFLVANVDIGFVGKFLSVTALGYYTIANNLSGLPALNIAQLINRVMFPTYAKLQDKRDALSRVYLKTIKYVAVLAAPISAGMIVLAPELVSVLLGEKWTPAIQPLQILCIAGLCRSIRVSMGPLLSAIGRPDLNKKLSFYELTTMCVLIYPLSLAYGISGTGLAVSITVAIYTIVGYAVTDRMLSIGWRKLSGELLAPFAASIAMAGIIMSARSLIPYGVLASLLILTAIGAMAYVAILYVLRKDLFKELKELGTHAIH